MRQVAWFATIQVHAQGADMSIVISDSNNELKTKFFEKRKARIHAALDRYVKRHGLDLCIAPFDGHCLAFDLDMGELSTQGSIDGHPWCGAYDLMKHAAKFKEAGFDLCDITVAAKNRGTKKKHVFVSFVMEIDPKHWNFAMEIEPEHWN